MIGTGSSSATLPEKASASPIKKPQKKISDALISVNSPVGQTGVRERHRLREHVTECQSVVFGEVERVRAQTRLFHVP